MNDPVVDAIRKGILSSDIISFQYLRSFAGRDVGKWSELGRGREVLSTTEQLDQYLYSYGPMIYDQWKHLLDKVRIPDDYLTILDYGCGQGLATMLLIDRFRETLSDSVASVILIEPSLVALTSVFDGVKARLFAAVVSALGRQWLARQTSAFRSLCRH